MESRGEAREKKRANAGRFITLEGGDGAGKSTLLTKIEAELKRRSLRFLSTREPGGTPIADEIRDLLLKPGRTLDPICELLLFEASRAEHVARLVRPALEAGTHVLCDRFTHSSLAFQGHARGLGSDLVARLNQIATAGLEPDCVIWLKLSPVEAAARIAGRGERSRIDAEKHEFHERVFTAFEKLARDEHERFIVLDAGKTPDAIFADLVAHPKWKELLS